MEQHWTHETETAGKFVNSYKSQDNETEAIGATDQHFAFMLLNVHGGEMAY